MTNDKTPAPAELDFANLATAAIAEPVPAVTVVRTKETNPFVALVAELEKDRTSARTIPLPKDISVKAYNKVERFLREAAETAGHSVRLKKVDAGVTVWAIDRVTRVRKPKDK